MKKREVVTEPSRLTWNNVLSILTEGSPDGFTTSELAKELGTDLTQAGALCRIMFEAGAIARFKVSKTGILYFASGR